MISPADAIDCPLVLDASALINLVATSDPLAILNSLVDPVVVEEAAREVRRNPRTRETGAIVLDPLLASGSLQQVKLTEDDAQHFVDLVGASPPDDLDDGEAATLAYAISRGYAVVIDERKAARVVRERYDHILCVTTVRLYRYLLEHRAADRSFISSCVYDSIRLARMRVTAAESPWVLQLLDPTQRANCPSLRQLDTR